MDSMRIIAHGYQASAAAMGVLLGLLLTHSGCLTALAVFVFEVVLGTGVAPEFITNAHALGLSPWRYFLEICATAHP